MKLKESISVFDRANQEKLRKDIKDAYKKIEKALSLERSAANEVVKNIEKNKNSDSVSEDEDSYITAKIRHVIYPQKGVVSDNGFAVVDYVCLDSKDDNPLAVTAKGEDLFSKKFRGVGEYILLDDLTYKLYGEWVEDNFGRSFQISSYEIVWDDTKPGIVYYLKSLKGIGDKIAERIYNEFKDKTFDVLENNPDELLKIHGISDSKLKTIVDSHNAKRGARSAIVALSPLGVPISTIQRMHLMHGAKTVPFVVSNPFNVVSHIGYSRALSLARLFDVSEDRILSETMLYVLRSVERTNLRNRDAGYNIVGGSVCVPFDALIIESQNLLNKQISNEMFEESLETMLASGIVFDRKDGDIVVYHKASYDAELDIVDSVYRIMNADKEDFDIYKYLAEVEEQSFRLIGDQEKAVVRSLENNLSIITGGPGTGKTTIIRFIVDVYKKAFPHRKIVLLAPTGRAAKNMTESTGEAASTIHSALGLSGNDFLAYLEPEDESLEGSLIIVDESSMIDIHLARFLLKSIKTGSKVIFIGDVDQLPSIGPGTFFKDLISSQRVPTTRLSKIYRVDTTSGPSNIILNSNFIKNGQTFLDYTDLDGDFPFIYASDFKRAEELIIREYEKAVKEVGIDEVSLLSPFRKRTATGVDNINPILQSIVNPKDSSKDEVKIRDKIFRVGDKIMETVNKDSIVNGDIGYIIDIKEEQASNNSVSYEFIIDFGDGQIVVYDESDILTVSHAYATTIHKSQGSEYDIVIINLMDNHSIMLKRNLIYTAVTRAKKKCIIIGTKSAVSKAIIDNSMQYRHGKLVERLQEADFFE